MEKELFLSTLKGKAQVDNLSDRTYEEVAALWLPQFADDTKITEESWDIPVRMLKTMSGQLRHDVSAGIASGKTQWETEKDKAIETAIAAAKAEWEKKKGEDTPPADPEPPHGEAPIDVDKKIAEAMGSLEKKLMGEGSALDTFTKQFSDFMKAQAAKEKELQLSNARNEVREHLLSRGVDSEDFALEYTLEKLVVGDNPDLSALKAKAEKDYEAYYKKIHKDDGAKPFSGGSGSGSSVVSEIEAWSRSRQAQIDSEAAAAEVLSSQIYK